MAAGPSAVYILDAKGKVLISRNYRGDVPFSVAEKFMSKVLEEEEVNIKPIVEEEGITYIYIKHQNLYRKTDFFLKYLSSVSFKYLSHPFFTFSVLAVTNRNANAAMILLFLYKIVGVFVEYFKELEEESIRDNFVIIYELLDEMMDFGYPQATEPKLLQEYVALLVFFFFGC